MIVDSPCFEVPSNLNANKSRLKRVFGVRGVSNYGPSERENITKQAFFHCTSRPQPTMLYTIRNKSDYFEKILFNHVNLMINEKEKGTCPITINLTFLSFK